MDTELRTTSFRLTAQYFGSVFVYKPGPRFKAAWRRLSDVKRPPGYDYGLPDSSLRTALTVISGDFVTLEAKKWGREDWAIVSRKQIGLPDLRRALAAWEYTVWPEGASGELADAADDLCVEQVSIAGLLGRRARRCPSPEARWIWKAATWEVAHRLSSQNLLLDQGRMVALRLDSEACLLTWDTLQRAGKKDDCAAMHVITPRLITIPGLEEPVVHLQSSFVRLATLWNRVKDAWICHRPELPLLCSGVGHRRDAGGESLWADFTPSVLRKCNLEIPATPSDIDLSAFGPIRCRLPIQRYPIGTGPGQMFHDAVAQHALRLLPDSVPLEMVKARQSLMGRPNSATDQTAMDVAVKANGADRLHITCLYGHDQTRQRVVKALKKLLGLPADAEFFARNDVETPVGATVTVVFVSPRGASARLSGDADRGDLASWVDQAVRPPFGTLSGKIIRAAIVETGNPDALRGTDRDPKHFIRRALAAKGIVSQFLSNREEDEEGGDEEQFESDHPAERALWDLLRSAGVFPRAFPLSEGIPADTWLVGVHVVQRRNNKRSGYSRKWGEGFVVSVVAVKAGGHRAMGYDKTGGWKPLHEFTARFLASPQDEDDVGAKSVIETAVSQLLTRDPHSKLVLFLGAQGCRRFWNALQDTRGDELPRCARADRVGIVRVRPDSEEVPRVAGVGSWPSNGSFGPQRPHTTNALYRLKDEQWPGAMYYVSTSSTMDRQGSHRDYTRFSCPANALRKNWHAHTMTEFWSPFPGPFREDSLYELAALLCRQAPTWNGTLNRPSPIHLAEAVVLDHPDKYETRNGEGETLVEGG